MWRGAPCIAFAAMVALDTAFGAEQSRQQARVTQLVREVSLLDASIPPRRATLNETVGEGTGVRTGTESRAELTFRDLTITRLGANSLYSFKRAGRDIELNVGATLLRVPKNSGGASIVSGAVVAGITGTTLILETTRAGESRLTVLEGTARLTLARHRDQYRDLLAGQSLLVPAGAVRIPAPQEIDLDRLMKTSPLVVGFAPLPSRDQIGAAIKQQQERNQGNPNGPSRNDPNRAAAPQPNAPAPAAAPPPAAPPPGPGR